MVTTESGSAALRRRAEAIRWFHLMDLGHGVVTDGMVDPGHDLDRIGLPESLAGRTVLDVGTWDGFYAFVAARRGADRVVATDFQAWGPGSWGSKDAFDLAREALGSQVDGRRLEIREHRAADLGTFDVVLLLGVVYHRQDILETFETVAALASDLLILETVSSLNWLPFPAARCFPGRAPDDRHVYRADPSNWWAPNAILMRSFLRAQGFRSVRVFSKARLPRRMARRSRADSGVRTLTSRPGRGGGMGALHLPRVTIHARR